MKSVLNFVLFLVCVFVIWAFFVNESNADGLNNEQIQIANVVLWGKLGNENVLRLCPFPRKYYERAFSWEVECANGNSYSLKGKDGTWKVTKEK